MQKTKKQHYIPCCYLIAFAMPGTKQVSVYDKKVCKTRTNNIDDVASENYFHDLSKEGLATIRDILVVTGLSQGKIDDQFIEHFFANEVEPAYSGLLNKLRSSAIKYTPWYEQNCLILTYSEKIIFSVMLAFQHMRTRASRNMIYDVSDILMQALGESTIAGGQKLINETQSLNNDDVHNEMLINMKHVGDLALSFLRLTWLMGVNRTAIPLITSDNPIVRTAHAHDEFMPMSGVGSKGIEIEFPIAPNAILIMLDDEYHKTHFIDRSYVEVDEGMVNGYNTLQVCQFHRCLFSPSDNFSLIDRLLKDHPDILEKRTPRMTHGGKVYYPRSIER
jgi:hypothetical protein